MHSKSSLSISSARLWTVIGLVGLATVSRLVPHPPNLVAVGAVALFSGASLHDRRLAFGIPLLAMLLSDLVLGFHALLVPVYTGVVAYSFFGKWAGSGMRPSKLIPAGLAGGVAFFAITNAACWWLYYEHTWLGFSTCFLAALPFFQNTFIGDVAFGVSLFGSLAVVEYMFPAVRPASATVAA